MKIATARDLFGVTDQDSHHRWVISRGSVKQRMAQLRINASQLGDPNTPDTNASRAVAYVNHGRWVADCPSEYCRSAMAVTPGHMFMCGGCLNVEIGSRYRMIEWPQERGAIEEALAARPVPEVANWRPGETTRHLRDENGAHQIRGAR